MLHRALPALLVALAACGPLEDVEPDAVSRRTDAVVGGRASFADPEIFLLYIRYSGGGAAICSSTLIAPRTLLTAAHCLEDSPSRISATNKPSMELADGTDFIPAKSWRAHPSFRATATGIFNDVAAVELAREPFAPTKAWNTTPEDDLKRKPIRVVGYGLTSSTGTDDSGFKRSGASMVRSILDDQHLELGKDGANRSGTCQGDSGGPALFTYPDGVERVVGVTSYGGSVCGPGVDARVDRFQQAINGWVDEFENGTCAGDHRCRAGCMPEDPDCACLENGQCNAACAVPSPDPDCAAACDLDGVCSNAACATADPDCQVLGGSCGRAGHCGSRLCITSAQHEVPYCSQACSASQPCPGGYTCSSAGQCELTPLPAAAPGEACTPGATWCGGPQYACRAWAKDPQTRCMMQCFESADCDAGWTCTVEIDSGEIGVCVENVVVPRLSTEKLKAEGCTAAPGGLASLVLLALLRRRR